MDALMIVLGLIAITIFIFVIIFILIIWLTVDSDVSLILASMFGKKIKSLRGKVVWVSGASTGLGEAIALKLASVGAKIVITGNEDTHEQVKAKCLEASNGLLNEYDILALPPFDIRDVEKHEQIVNNVLNHFKTVDVLINNVGRTQRANFDSIPHQVERDMMDINVLGQINLTKIIVRNFKAKQKGQLAVTSSLCGKFSSPFSASYNATKFALHAYFDCIRNEYPFIDVTIVCPGPIFTQNISKAHMAGQFEDSKRSYDENDKRMKVERAAHLYCLALANRLDEVCYGLQLVFWVFYAAQYAPSTFRKIYKRFASPDKVIAMREGRKETV